MSAAFTVIRYAFNVSVGGREVAAFAGIAVATFMATALGTMFGAIPKLRLGAKIGIATGISTLLSLFAGLYGDPSMELGDAIQRNSPLLSDLNPVRQVSMLFYDILYYESYTPFIRTMGILAAMSAAFLAMAIILLRRQRYEHL